MVVATGSVTGRRQLHFDSLDDILADVERLNQGQVKTLGNWSPGQVLRHLTIVMTGSMDGFRNRPPWFIRLLGKVMKRRMLTKPMSAGFQLPKNAATEFIPGPIEWDDALGQLRIAIRSIATRPCSLDRPRLHMLPAQPQKQLRRRGNNLEFATIKIRREWRRRSRP